MADGGILAFALQTVVLTNLPSAMLHEIFISCVVLNEELKKRMTFTGEAVRIEFRTLAMAMATFITKREPLVVIQMQARDEITHLFDYAVELDDFCTGSPFQYIVSWTVSGVMEVTFTLPDYLTKPGLSTFTVEDMPSGPMVRVAVHADCPEGNKNQPSVSAAFAIQSYQISETSEKQSAMKSLDVQLTAQDGYTSARIQYDRPRCHYHNNISAGATVIRSRYKDLDSVSVPAELTEAVFPRLEYFTFYRLWVIVWCGHRVSIRQREIDTGPGRELRLLHSSFPAGTFRCAGQIRGPEQLLRFALTIAALAKASEVIVTPGRFDATVSVVTSLKNAHLLLVYCATERTCEMFRNQTRGRRTVRTTAFINRS